jgi:hypothetical protein
MMPSVRETMSAVRPVPGDFLIHRVSNWAGVLLVDRDRDHPQLSCQTYQAALAHATREAAHSNVDVWQTQDGARFERLVSYRGGNA